jgi:hypothetical protein
MIENLLLEDQLRLKDDELFNLREKLKKKWLSYNLFDLLACPWKKWLLTNSIFNILPDVEKVKDLCCLLRQDVLRVAHRHCRSKAGRQKNHNSAISVVNWAKRESRESDHFIG